ncbi:MAG TPA: type II toxin-antitoxin system prevent-host-death family antitoxin [Nitrospirota bacterium]
MTKTITATEAVRKFSEILNSIKYKGDHYTVVRGGKPVASITPVETTVKTMVLGDLPGLVKTLPPLGEEAERFKKDILKALKHQPLLPETHKWA